MTSWEGDNAEPTAGSPRSRMWGGITRRQLWVVAGVAAVAGGLALNWGWLTAVGAAPILIAVLPCAAMCALGLCVLGRHGASPADGHRDGGPSAQIKTPPPAAPHRDP